MLSRLEDKFESGVHKQTLIKNKFTAIVFEQIKNIIFFLYNFINLVKIFFIKSNSKQDPLGRNKNYVSKITIKTNLAVKESFRLAIYWYIDIVTISTDNKISHNFLLIRNQVSVLSS